MIVKADLSAAELRVCAVLAYDEPWLEDFAAGRSPHLKNAAALFGRAVGKEEPEYTFAKSLVFRWIYTIPDKPPTMDPGQLRVGGMAIAPMMLQQFGERLNGAHPRIVLRKRKVIAELHKTGLARNPWGRYRDLRWALVTKDEKWVQHAEQAALNHGIQTSIGEVVDMALIRLHGELKARGLPAAIIAQRHDELVVETSKGYLEIVAQLMRTAMEQPIEELGGLVIPCEVTAGKSWGEQDIVL